MDDLHAYCEKALCVGFVGESDPRVEYSSVDCAVSFYDYCSERKLSVYTSNSYPDKCTDVYLVMYVLGNPRQLRNAVNYGQANFNSRFTKRFHYIMVLLNDVLLNEHCCVKELSNTVPCQFYGEIEHVLKEGA